MPIQQLQPNKDPKLLQLDKFLVDVQEFLWREYPKALQQTKTK